jgi:hypothetical protein
MKYSGHQASIYWHDLIVFGLVELLLAGSEIYTFGITSTSSQMTKQIMNRYFKILIICFPFEANCVFNLKVLV